MRHAALILASATLVLAACESSQYPYGGVSTAPVYGSGSSGPVYAGSASLPSGASASTPACAAQQATILHQNRVGGSDYNAQRCRTQGY
jgi:hypothetical protein